MQSLPGLEQGQGGARPSPAVVLTIAGLDPSSGAGLTADLKVFAAFRLFGLSCPTALTVQSTQGVRSSEPVSPAYVAAALDCLAEDLPIRGVKIGALASADVARAVAAWLRRYRTRSQWLPVVLDPVLISSSGHLLLEAKAVSVLQEELLPLCTVLTPNLQEALALSGSQTGPEAARSLTQQMSDDPQSAVVLTGGDTENTDTVADLLVLRSGQEELLTGRRVHTRSTHGTGCAFSSALLCGLVAGVPVLEAARAAKHYVEQALAAAYPVGQGRGPMHHLFAFEQTCAAASARAKPSH